MSLTTAGIHCTICRRLSGAMEDYSIDRVQQLRTLCRQRCCMSASRGMFGSLWNAAAAAHRQTTNAWTNVLFASPDSLPQLAQLPLRQTAVTWADSDSWLLMTMPRSRAVSWTATHDDRTCTCVMSSLTWTQPHNLGFCLVQSKPNGSQPGLDTSQTRDKTVDR